MTQHFYSHGKLLLTGEYAVIDGALAIGLPTAQGQSMTVTPIKQDKIIWQAFDHNKQTWFETDFSLPLDKDDYGSTIRSTLHQLLQTAQKLNPDFMTQSGYAVTTSLEFNRDWGLGSSSTFINNIAQWANVNAFDLLWSISNGSGYDIACAQNNTAITYAVKDKKPTTTPVTFTPPFIDQLFFIHLNKKQDSRAGITHYRQCNIPDDFIDDISQLSRDMLTCTTIDDFNRIITEHENIVGDVLKILPVKRRLFSDYTHGAIKSLGAWGGDFILASGNEKTPDYFKQRGYDTVIAYNNMIKV